MVQNMYQIALFEELHFIIMLFTAFVVDIDKNDDHSAYIWIDKSEMDMYNIDSWTLHQLAQTKF